jgi:hypothetical protein
MPFSLCVQVSQLYSTTDLVTVLYVLIFVLLYTSSFIPYSVYFRDLIIEPRYLNVCNLSKFCPFNSVSLLATFTVSLVVLYLILSVLTTNPTDTVAVCSCMRTSFSVPTLLPIVVTSSVQTMNCLVLLKLVPHALIYIFLITFSIPIINNNVARESPYLIPHSLLKLLDNLF